MALTHEIVREAILWNSTGTGGAPSKRFWDLWKLDKMGMKALGYSVTKNEYSGDWQVKIPTVILPTSMPALNLSVVSPNLKGYQVEGIEYLGGKPSAILGDEMGTGKTAQAISTILALDAFPVVVVCPATLKLNWQREVATWAPGKSCSIVNGTKCLITPADVVILNYDIVNDHLKTLLAMGFNSMLCDEAHYLKNLKAKRTKAVKKISGAVKYRYLLTGTPVLNRPVELSAPLEILGMMPAIAGSAFDYGVRYCAGYQAEWGWDFTGASNVGELHDKLKANCYIRRTKAEVLKELSPKIRHRIDVDIEGESTYRKAAINFKAYFMEKKPETTELLEIVKINELRKLSSEAKLKAAKTYIEDFLEDSGEKLVVFAHFRDTQAKLLEAFPQAARIVSDMSQDDRQANVDRFQNDPDCKLIICSLKSAGVGITLTAASNLLFIDQDWTPAIMDQAEDRCHRIGQTDVVTAHYLISKNSIDEQIWDLVEEKRKLVTMITDGKEVILEDQSVASELIARILKQD